MEVAGSPFSRVVVIDESDAVRAKVADALAERGVTTLAHAGTRAEADARLAEAAPTLVVAELLDPPTEGLLLVERLLAAHPRACVVLLTAEPADGPLARRAIRMGVFAVVPKPLRREALSRALDEVEAEHAGVVRFA